MLRFSGGSEFIEEGFFRFMLEYIDDRCFWRLFVNFPAIFNIFSNVLQFLNSPDISRIVTEDFGSSNPSSFMSDLRNSIEVIKMLNGRQPSVVI